MANLQYSAIRKGKTSIITIGGSLDASTAPNLSSKLEDELKKQPDTIVINMNKLDYIASAGIGILISLNEKMANRKAKLKLCEANSKIKKIFQSLGFDSLFAFYSTEPEALDS